MKRVGANIKRIRLERGMSQDKLAELTGYSERSTISRIENGEVDITTTKLKQICSALNCDISDILDVGSIEFDSEVQRLFSLLSDDQKKQVVDYLSFLVNRV